VGVEECLARAGTWEGRDGCDVVAVAGESGRVGLNALPHVLLCLAFGSSRLITCGGSMFEHRQSRVAALRVSRPLSSRPHRSSSVY
jgi:hypothetical protein